MAVKLFHSTGFPSQLRSGEARHGKHPATLVALASLWLALACNVAVWRLLAGTTADARLVLASVLMVAGGSGFFFSVLGWRRTIKAAITFALILGALLACGLWSQQLPIDTLWLRPSRALLPAWASFLRWQVLGLTLVLAVLPIVWLWNTPLRRLPADQQLLSNFAGACAGVLLLAGGLLLLG
jgi:glucan phosphoethanolaminetransferase (alkaline phosphatase superfamily)